MRLHRFFSGGRFSGGSARRSRRQIVVRDASVATPPSSRALSCYRTSGTPQGQPKTALPAPPTPGLLVPRGPRQQAHGGQGQVGVAEEPLDLGQRTGEDHPRTPSIAADRRRVPSLSGGPASCEIVGGEGDGMGEQEPDPVRLEPRPVVPTRVRYVVLAVVCSLAVLTYVQRQ